MSTAPESGNETVDFDLGELTVDAGREDEGLFSRDVDGQLIRVEEATANQLDQDVTLTINGQSVAVKKAVPTRDSQGNVINDPDGAPIPRLTTIFDATSQAFVKKPGDPNPIPTLCHKEHLPPIGVCRVCLVEATEQTGRGTRRQLVPSCVQKVSDGMIVHTIDSDDQEAAARVRAASSIVVELLMSDHLPSERETGPGNELAAVADRLGIARSRFSPSPAHRSNNQTSDDQSSEIIAVDHDQCILCGRCQRGCNWVKGNNVIGRDGKGYQSRIAFDLNDPMGHSTCVSCGECALSCPTGALEFKDSFIDRQITRLKNELREDKKDGDIVTADELINYPLFSGIPYKFLQFNGAAVVRRVLEEGDVLCREGDYGSTAFVILKGEFEIFLSTTRGAVRNRSAGGILGWLGGLKTVVEKVGGRAKLADVGAAPLSENERILRNEEDVILGEMTCMNRYPRSATVVATKPGEVLEIKRNVLYMLQRNAVSREILERVYRERSLRGQLASLPIFDTLDDASRETAAEFLRDKVDLVSVDPGQTIFRQGDLADNYYVSRLGFVKISQRYGRDERVLNYLGPGNGFGEIGLLSDLGGDFDEDELGNIRPGTRTATCSALDHVELVRIGGDDFRDLLLQFPELRRELAAKAKQILARDDEARGRLQAIEADEYLDQGLYLAQSLLVLDLERCTRCDECTKACADTHEGVTRLVRDGLRFDKYLVASSCRSCMDPYCLVGCPVDAIHRNGESLEIEIEDYCIGCGLCADNCPYGNINMHGFPKQEYNEKGRPQKVFQIVDGQKVEVIQQRATTCDLCKSVDGKPSCVYACPHEAAFRMTGKELLEITNKP